MKAQQWVRLVVLAFAFMSAVGVIALVACGPAAPAQQSAGAANVSDSVAGMATEVPFVLQQSGDGEKEEPTATPYPDDCMEFKRPDNGEMIMVCPEPGPRAIEQDLRKMYNAFMAEKELAAQRGAVLRLGPPYSRFESVLRRRMPLTTYWSFWRPTVLGCPVTARKVTLMLLALS